MSRSTGYAVLFTLFFGVFSAAQAQGRPPEQTGERYSFQVTDRGVMRFDSRTGQVSQCLPGASGMICRATPDERVTFENEIARLETENAALKKALAERGGVLSTPPVPPGSIPNVADNAPDPGSKSEPEPARSRIRTALETAWRNVVAMVSRVKSALQ